MRKVIITHNGVFHADEVTAIALLTVFTNDTYEVTRLPHQSPNLDGDLIIDIGREYDGVKHFDHHQYAGGKSSAGLIFEYLNLGTKYPKIAELIKMVDENDTGVNPEPPFSYSKLISGFNSTNIYSEEQKFQFHKAIEFSCSILSNMKREQEENDKSVELLSQSMLWEGTTDVLLLPQYINGWQNYINGISTPEIEAVVWQDAVTLDWKIQTTPKEPNSFERVGKKLLPSPKMDFVHANGFFAVCEKKETMDYYIKNCRG